MVYCGKASQGCQNCRTRRIKCDKVRPECSQCLRVHKKCPGYRDQLSLMFRDESTKVIQKAHASWGFDQGGSSRSSESSPASSSSSASSLKGSPGPGTPTDKASPSFFDSVGVVTKLPPTIDPTKMEKGVQFYLDHYLIGHPDEPRSVDELRRIPWLNAPGMAEGMAAVGLAGLSNLHGSEELQRLAQQNYGLALQNTVKTLQKLPNLNVGQATTSVVMLAMFEVVKGNHEPSSAARTHIIGAASLLGSFAPWQPGALTGGMRGLLQLCCSLVSSVQRSLLLGSAEPEVLIPRQLIPCQVIGLALPESFFNWVKLSAELVPPVDKPATDLLQILTQFVQLSAFVSSHLLVDGREDTVNTVREVIQFEQKLEAWERQLEGIWLYTEVAADDFPQDTVFHSKFHAYTDMWSARIWNHYRWCRLLTNQMMVEFADRFPESSLGLISEATRQLSLETIRRIAEDTLVSMPTHWRHPRMSRRYRDIIDKMTGGPGIGAAGLPSTLFHMKVAACAPGVPFEYYRWTLSILDTVWGDMGMLQAKSLADLMRKHYHRRQALLADANNKMIKQELP